MDGTMMFRFEYVSLKFDSRAENQSVWRNLFSVYEKEERRKVEGRWGRGLI